MSARSIIVIGPLDRLLHASRSISCSESYRLKGRRRASLIRSRNIGESLPGGPGCEGGAARSVCLARSSQEREGAPGKVYNPVY